MRTIVSLEFEHKKWSWGHISQPLLNELNEFEIMSMEFKQWKARKNNIDKREVCFLSQNVSQFRELTDYDRIVARLGGNRTFEDFPERRKDYFEKMSRCFAIVATNQKLKNIALEANANVYLIPNGLDLKKWVFKERDFKSKDFLTVGFVGNVKSLKKIEYKGYSIIKDVCKKLKFPLSKALYENKQIPHDQMQKKFYDNIDVLALLTDGEGCSNTIMECLACGVPVITTKEAGYHGEILSHENNVFFCEKSWEAFFEHLKWLNQNRRALRRIAIGGRLFAESHHDITMIAKEFKKIFDSCFEYNDILSPEEKVHTEMKTSSKKFIPVKFVPLDLDNSIFDHPQSDVAVVCVLKSGGVYSIDYVEKLRNMIDRNTTVPYEFICLTDMDIDANICKSIKLIRGQAGWWSKIELFRSNLINAKQIIYFDLDTIILKNIDDVLNFQHDFSGLYPWNEKNRRNGLCASGMMAWKNDSTFSFLFDRFDPNRTKNYPRGDQEYISQILKSNKKNPEFLQTLFSGIYSYKRNCRIKLPKNARIVCFHGKPRLHEINIRWVKDHWR